MSASNLDPALVTAIKASDESGVCLKDLPVGTVVVARTRNSEYTFEVRADGIWVKGGKYFPEFKRDMFNGSTWGGSCLRMLWVATDMHLEFVHPDKPQRVTTSKVSDVRITQLHGSPDSVPR